MKKYLVPSSKMVILPKESLMFSGSVTGEDTEDSDKTRLQDFGSNSIWATDDSDL